MGKEAVSATEQFMEISWARTTKDIFVLFDNAQDLMDYAKDFEAQGATHIDVEMDPKNRVAFVRPEWKHPNNSKRSKSSKRKKTPRINPPLIRQPVRERPFREGFKPLA